MLLKASLDSPVNKHGSGILCCRSDTNSNCSQRRLVGDDNAAYICFSPSYTAMFLIDSRSQLSDFEETTSFMKPSVVVCFAIFHIKTNDICITK